MLDRSTGRLPDNSIHRKIFKSKNRIIELFIFIRTGRLTYEYIFLPICRSTIQN
jgi:hypothetical protein